MLGGYVGKTICHCILGAYMWYENKRRNKVYGEPDPVMAADNGMKGMTEIESESRVVAFVLHRHSHRSADVYQRFCRHSLPIRLVRS